ncbi:MAG: hypothetical protein NZ529_07685 [Cytophagaceae bacterium]|nr:hypothetical protein [Cytophagaceae bacterium]MDW8456666.1 hypothetical protein [Cytophagaceae bacterium]
MSRKSVVKCFLYWVRPADSPAPQGRALHKKNISTDFCADA